MAGGQERGAASMSSMTPWLGAIWGIVTVTLLAGCVTNTVQEVREASTGISATESVVVLGRRTRPSSAETELDFISCVSKNIGKGSDKIGVIAEQDFLDAMFPWFEPRTAPVNTSDLPQLIGQAPLDRKSVV